MGHPVFCTRGQNHVATTFKQCPFSAQSRLGDFIADIIFREEALYRFLQPHFLPKNFLK